MVPQLRAVSRNLLHDNGVTEFGEKTVNALDGGIRDLALLERTVHVPILTNTTLNEVGDKLRADEVDEGVSDIEVIGEVDTKVREVVMALRSIIEEQLQVLKVDTVGDVAQHDSSANIDTGLNLVDADCLRLVPAPELQIGLVTWAIAGKPVGLTARVVATITTTVASTEATRGVFPTRAGTVTITVVTSCVVVVAFVGLTRNGKVISGSHQVSHTRSGRVDVAHVAGRLIRLDRHGDRFLMFVNDEFEQADGR